MKSSNILSLIVWETLWVNVLTLVNVYLQGCHFVFLVISCSHDSPGSIGVLFVSPVEWKHLYLRSIKQQRVVQTDHRTTSVGLGSIYFSPKNRAPCWGRLKTLSGVLRSLDASGERDLDQ